MWGEWSVSIVYFIWEELSVSVCFNVGGEWCLWEELLVCFVLIYVRWMVSVSCVFYVRGIVGVFCFKLREVNGQCQLCILCERNCQCLCVLIYGEMNGQAVVYFTWSELSVSAVCFVCRKFLSTTWETVLSQLLLRWCLYLCQASKSNTHSSKRILFPADKGQLCFNPLTAIVTSWLQIF